MAIHVKASDFRERKIFFFWVARKSLWKPCCLTSLHTIAIDHISIVAWFLWFPLSNEVLFLHFVTQFSYAFNWNLLYFHHLMCALLRYTHTCCHCHQGLVRAQGQPFAAPLEQVGIHCHARGHLDRDKVIGSCRGWNLTFRNPPEHDLSNHQATLRSKGQGHGVNKGSMLSTVSTALQTSMQGPCSFLNFICFFTFFRPFRVGNYHPTILADGKCGLWHVSLSTVPATWAGLATNHPTVIVLYSTD